MCCWETLSGSSPIVCLFNCKNINYASNENAVSVSVLNIFLAGILLSPLSPACISLYGRLIIVPERKLNIFQDIFMSKVRFRKFYRGRFLQGITTSNSFNFSTMSSRCSRE
jgi:hypothetical protein